MRAAVLGLGDHRLEALDLLAQGGDLAVDRGRWLRRGSIARRSATSSVDRKRLRGCGPGPASSSSSWPISASEKPGVVAQPADEPEALEVLGVVQAVGALGAGGRGEQPELLVVADRPRGEAGVGGDLLDAEEALGGCGGGRGTVSVTRPV